MTACAAAREPECHVASHMTTRTPLKRAKRLFAKAMQEASSQFSMGGPLALNLFFVYMLQIVTMAFLGHCGTQELAAASLAMVACNTLGALLFMGLCGATDTLAAQVRHVPAHGL